MSTPFIGEIRIFAGDYTPLGWVFCEGQELSIAKFNALYTVIGNLYGPSDRVNFLAPDLRGTAPLHPGQGSGLTLYTQGQRTGASSVTLTAEQMGTHGHRVSGVETNPSVTTPAGHYVARAVNRDENRFQNSTQNLVTFGTTSAVGAGNPHNNMQPYQALRYLIAYQGTYPPSG